MCHEHDNHPSEEAIRKKKASHNGNYAWPGDALEQIIWETCGNMDKFFITVEETPTTKEMQVQPEQIQVQSQQFRHSQNEYRCNFQAKSERIETTILGPIRTNCSSADIITASVVTILTNSDWGTSSIKQKNYWRGLMCK